VWTARQLLGKLLAWLVIGSLQNDLLRSILIEMPCSVRLATKIML